MKLVLVIALVIALGSCTVPRELEAEIVSAELIRIDTVYRFDDRPKQALIWRDTNKIDYITYASLQDSYSLGSKMMVLVKR